MNTIRNSFSPSYNRLKTYYSDPIYAQQVFWWLLAFITKKSQNGLILGLFELSAAQKNLLENYINQIVTEHKPIGYILGTIPFRKLELIITPPLLIPRPETEEWVTNLIEKVKKCHNKPKTMLDIGTGSGCIALSLAEAFSDSHIIAVDINPTAITVAQDNAKKNNITNVTFFESDLFSALSPEITFDLIVSNPPYIAESEFVTLDPSVRLWEDKKALVACENGLSIISQIINQSFHRLNAQTCACPQIVIEIGHEQGDVVKTLFEQRGYAHACIEKDLSGKDRTVCTKK